MSVVVYDGFMAHCFEEISMSDYCQSCRALLQSRHFLVCRSLGLVGTEFYKKLISHWKM